MLGDIGKPIADFQAALTEPSPLTFLGQQRRALLAHRGQRLSKTVGQRFAGQFVEQRLAIEGIELTWTPFHEQKDHTLGGRWMVSAAKWVSG